MSILYSQQVQINDSKSLPRRDANAADFKTQNNKNSEDIYVTKYTRAGKYGKAICCPVCDNIQTVYHFAWSGLTCLSCKQSVDKYRWKVRTIQDRLGLDSNTHRRED